MLFKKASLPQDVHSSAIFQLALKVASVFKASNYARFMHIMGSPSTPTLFALAMFRHVNSVRVEALEVIPAGLLSRTSNYPVEHLSQILRFPTPALARNFCSFYNIKWDVRIC